MTHRLVRLTFDDGPSPATTPQLLEHLGKYRLKATFFVVGHPEGQAILQKIALEGHQIGNHSYSHGNLTIMTAKQIEDEIKQTESLIGSLDQGIKLFRPPYGLYNPLVDQIARDLGYQLVLWNVTSLDWKQFYWNRRWVSHTMRQIKAKQDCIVLAHDVWPSTVDFFPELVSAIQKLPDTEFCQLTRQMDHSDNLSNIE
jgi:peptidoglycan-N-acetylglucosamine deacetylase